MEMKLLTAMEMDPDGNGKIPREKFSHSNILSLRKRKGNVGIR